MDFGLSAEQRELTEATADFARRELNQDLVKRDVASLMLMHLIWQPDRFHRKDSHAGRITAS